MSDLVYWYCISCVPHNPKQVPPHSEAIPEVKQVPAWYDNKDLMVIGLENDEPLALYMISNSNFSHLKLSDKFTGIRIHRMIHSE